MMCLCYTWSGNFGLMEWDGIVPNNLSFGSQQIESERTMWIFYFLVILIYILHLLSPVSSIACL
ncbi:hypothetical protein ASPWEDRAFT_624225 [Aspergillus wentii DTO 134E9]|uniref:Uncharacterized protein n=1 Tax=Aspergillus wentii DTO 134E9 TaxID=1073089 RepID=A0A1L9RF55_ASPWE|nr:uncharacterized protein ASPWEDRAFT_624225 [Aspergillus wentii DTO 134E9]OJJ33555.1 hypothetical protein ASPWEDRAFT_624225 [Aspergillus wentii DTO 134E9]